MSTTTRLPRECLEAFRRSLRREASAVAADPALLWQQLSNRLRQYDDLTATVLAEEEDRRLHTGSSPWFRIISPRAESPQLLGSIPAHGDVTFLDRTRLVTLDAGALAVWDAPSGMPTSTVRLTVEPLAFAVDPLGTVAVVAATDGLLVAEPATGAPVSRLERSEEPRHAFNAKEAALMLDLGLSGSRLRRGFCLSPNGSLVAGAQSSGAVTVWDAATGRVRSTFPEGAAPLTACAFTPEGDTLVFATRDGAVRAWRHNQGADHVVLNEAAGARMADDDAALVLDVAVAPDGTFAVAVTVERITVWDLPSGRRRWGLEHFGTGRCCAVTPDGLRVVTGGARGVLRLWDTANGTIAGTLAGHTGTVSRCAVSADGSLLASAGPDGIKLWDSSVSDGGKFFDTHARRVTAITFSPDGERLASAGADRRVLLWDATSRSRVGSLDGHEDAVQDCAFSRRDSSEILTAGRDGTARLWDVAAGEERRRLASGLDPWWGCAVHPDNTEALLGGTESLDRVALSSGERLATYPRDAETWRASFAPDGTWAVVSGAGGGVAFWDAATGRIEEVAGHSGVVGACAVSPDGRFAVTGAEDGTVRVWDVPDHGERLVLRHDAAVWGCSVTPDGMYVVSTSWDRTLRVWDVVTGLELMRLDLPTRLHGCAAHPWRTRVAFGDHTGRVHVVEPVGLPIGPVVVTAQEEGGELRARCPSCGAVRGLERTDLGAAYDCPCGLATRVAESPLPVETHPAVQEAGTAEGLARALGAQTPREQVLMHSTKTCTTCGHEFELLRHACPQCGRTGAMPPDVEATQFMQMRQARASDLVDQGALLFQSGQLDEAEATFRQAVEANPWNATACGNLGVVLLRRDRKQEALECFEKSVAIDPNVPGGQQLVAKLRAELSQVSEPEASAVDAVADARGAFNSRQWAEAVQHYGRVIDLLERGKPCGVAPHTLYGERATALAYLGDYRASIADLDRALGLAPGEWRYLDARGRAHYVLGQHDAAVSDWSAALEHLPPAGDDRAGVLLYRAAAYRQLDQPREALDDLVLADKACNNPEIRKGIEDLRRTILSEEGLG